MTQEHFDREVKFRAAITTAREMLAGGVISAADFSKIEEYFTKKYQPFFVE